MYSWNMPSPESLEPDAVKLLRGAVADPLTMQSQSSPDAPIAKWYELARQNAPLWTFNPWAFNRGRGDQLPSSFPLRRILESIAMDEEVDLADESSLGTRLLSHLYGIRVCWSQTRNCSPSAYHSEGRLRLGEVTQPQDVTSIPILGYREPRYDLPFLQIGADLVAYLEEVEAASTKKRRKKARKELGRYLDSFGGKLAHGRPPTGAPTRILDPLFEQGKWLFGSCWQALPCDPSEEACAILNELDAPKSEHQLWALRLALPMLSVAEIEAMLRGIAEPYGLPHTRPRRFTVFSIAHRLGLAAETLARRLPPKDDARRFFAFYSNPIRPTPPKN